MKTLTVFLTLVAFGITAIAQEQNAPKQEQTAPKDAQNVQTITPQQSPEKKMPPSEYVKMKGGKLWYSKDGTTTELTKEIKLAETTVKPDGTVLMKDGTTVTLKEENVVNSNGKVIDVALMRQKAMEQKKAEIKTEPATEPKAEPKAEPK